MNHRIMKCLLWAFPLLLAGGLQSCSESGDSSVSVYDLMPYVWESIGDSEYWIDPDVAGAERDKWNTSYYFLDSEHGIKCIYHYNFDYVDGHHTSDKKGYPFRYESYGRTVTLWFEESREELKISSNGDALEDKNGTNYSKRSYISSDNTFIDEWLPLCWPELANQGSGNSGSGNTGSGNTGGSTSSSPYDFQLQASTIHAFVSGKSWKWVVWLDFATNNLNKRKVDEFEILVRALNGTITNKKEYEGTLNLYPQNGNLNILVTGIQTITDNNLHWWSTCIYVNTYDQEELTLEFTPSWINSAGTYEGSTVTKTYKPTSIIE